MGDFQTAGLQTGSPWRDVLALAFDQRMTYEEIAAVLDIPIGTVRSRLHNGRARLRAHLQDPRP